MIVSCPTLSEINQDMTDIMASYFESHPSLKTKPSKQHFWSFREYFVKVLKMPYNKDIV